MTNISKKSDFETGTFMAYACNCSCFYYCGACNNCNLKNPQELGAYALDYATQVTNYNKSMSPLTLLG